MEPLKWDPDNTAEIRFDKKTRIKFSLINHGDDTSPEWEVWYEQWYYKNHQPDYVTLDHYNIAPERWYADIEELRRVVNTWYTENQYDIWIGVGCPFNPDDHVPTSGVTKFKGKWSACPKCGNNEMDHLDTEQLELISDGKEGDDAVIESLVCDNCDIIVSFIFPPNPVVEYDEEEFPIYHDPDREDDEQGWIVWQELTGFYEAQI